MKKITRGNDWIQINEDRIRLNAINRYQLAVASMELKLYMASGEIFKLALESEEEKDMLVNAFDEMCGLKNK